MPHRGLRKPAGRRSLRPRNHSSSPRTAAEQRASGPAPVGSHASESGLEAPAAEELPAHGGVAHDDHHDDLAHAFFEAEDRASHADDDADDHYVLPTLSRGTLRAMYASLGMFAVSVVVIGAYSFYNNMIMPAPVELGASVADMPGLIPTPIVEPARPAPRIVHPSLAAPAEPETQLSAATTLPALEVPRLNAPAASASAAAPVAKTEPSAPAAPAPQAEPATPAVVAAADSPSLAAAHPAAEGPVGQAADSAPVAAAPAAPPVAGAPTYDELVEVGRALSKKNRRNEASEAFRRALLQSPQGSAALSGLSFVYLNSNERQNAREFAQRAVQADASNAEGWIVLGAALELLGDRAGARDAYRSCVERGQGPYLVECRRVAR